MDRFSKKIFPNTVKSARLELGLTQIAFGQRIGIIGENISGWETGCAFPTDKTIDTLYSVYGINKEYLLHGVGEIFDNERMINNFVLRASAITNNELNKVSSYDLASYRLNNSIWPLYLKANANIYINVDDNVIICTSNSKNLKYLVATAKVDHICKYKQVHCKLKLEPTYKVPVITLTLKYISWFNKPLKMSEVINNQSQALADNKISKYIINRECTAISDDNFNMIMRAAYN